MLLFLGIIAIIVLMATVMGMPLIHHLKCDRKWEAAASKPLELWYNKRII